MDEYSPKRHDIAQLRFLCDTLYHDCLANLDECRRRGINDPTSIINFQINELIEHISLFALNYRIKFATDNNNKLLAQLEDYLDSSFMLFSRYDINSADLQKWRQAKDRLFRSFTHADLNNLINIYY
ncbi:Hha toxicity modulator TomB [Enterobacteriaceae bacterium ESL0689]|nr:Hha toxicity modulator TomB [Enterobacteriaceae bacterium ESL0689]